MAFGAGHPTNMESQAMQVKEASKVDTAEWQSLAVRLIPAGHAPSCQSSSVLPPYDCCHTKASFAVCRTPASMLAVNLSETTPASAYGRVSALSTPAQLTSDRRQRSTDSHFSHQTDVSRVSLHRQQVTLAPENKLTDATIGLQPSGLHYHQQQQESRVFSSHASFDGLVSRATSPWSTLPGWAQQARLGDSSEQSGLTRHLGADSIRVKGKSLQLWNASTHPLLSPQTTPFTRKRKLSMLEEASTETDSFSLRGQFASTRGSSCLKERTVDTEEAAWSTVWPQQFHSYQIKGGSSAHPLLCQPDPIMAPRTPPRYTGKRIRVDSGCQYPYRVGLQIPVMVDQNLAAAACKRDPMRIWGTFMRLSLSSIALAIHFCQRLKFQALNKDPRIMDWYEIVTIVGCLWVASKLIEKRLDLASTRQISAMLQSVLKLPKAVPKHIWISFEIGIMEKLKWQPFLGISL